eukprot:350108-Chlamydomonas_euryale.AAC.2
MLASKSNFSRKLAWHGSTSGMAQPAAWLNQRHGSTSSKHLSACPAHPPPRARAPRRAQRRLRRCQPPHQPQQARVCGAAVRNRLRRRRDQARAAEAAAAEHRRRDAL